MHGTLAGILTNFENTLGKQELDHQCEKCCYGDSNPSRERERLA